MRKAVKGQVHHFVWDPPQPYSGSPTLTVGFGAPLTDELFTQSRADVSVTAIANDRLAQGKPVFFVVVADLLDHLRSTFSPDSKISYDEFFEKIKETPLLILDDFGEQSATLWAQEKLYQLLNYRYNARLPMVVTTCLSLDEIETRISSRMVDPRLSLVFNIIAPDYRGDVKHTRQVRRH